VLPQYGSAKALLRSSTPGPAYCASSRSGESATSAMSSAYWLGRVVSSHPISILSPRSISLLPESALLIYLRRRGLLNHSRTICPAYSASSSPASA